MLTSFGRLSGSEISMLRRNIIVRETKRLQHLINEEKGIMGALRSLGCGDSLMKLLNDAKLDAPQSNVTRNKTPSVPFAVRYNAPAVWNVVLAHLAKHGKYEAAFRIYRQQVFQNRNFRTNVQIFYR